MSIMVKTDLSYYERRIKLHELENLCAEKRGEIESKMLDIYHSLWYDYLTELRYNHNHDSKGRFCSGSGSGSIAKPQRNISERDMANGLRKPASHILNDEEIQFVKSEINAIGADESIFRFNSGNQTGYVDSVDIINIRGDVFPDQLSNHPRDCMSVRAVVAHEYYGHRQYRNTKQQIGSWNDEFRASYMAAKNCPNLSDIDRYHLICDAVERTREHGVTIKYNSYMRKVLYGY